MNKKQFLQVIEKIYLGGLTEKIRLKINNNQLKVNFSVELKDCIGELTTPWEREDIELGVYNLTELYKLVKVTTDPIQIDVIDKVVIKYFVNI